jgi:hypothetical protein
MPRAKRIVAISISALSISALLTAAGTVVMAAEPAPTNAPVVKAIWQHHTVGFNYYGITALYTCDGLETNIRALLLYLGARKDAKAIARGCPGGPDVPSRNAILETDFYTLTPSDDARDTVSANWLPVEVSPTRPSFMGRGDCELIDEMKQLILKNFSLRNVSYRADCTPHEVNIDDFTIRAEVLKPLDSSTKK